MIPIQDYIDADSSCCYRRVIIEDLIGAQEFDLTRYLETATYKGTDLVDEVTWGADVDGNVTTMQVTLGAQARDDAGDRINLAPLKVPTSPLQPDNNTRIRVENYLELATGETRDWTIEWEGYIDDVVHSKDGYTIVLKCRDTMRPLVDKFIHRNEDDRVYGSVGGTPAEIVINNILSDEGLTPLTVPILPSFAITQYRQEKMSVQKAAQDIANNFAWSVRAWPDPLDLFHWKHSLIDPQRTKTVSDYTIPEKALQSVDSVSISSRRIRNSVQINAKRRQLGPLDNNQIIVGNFSDAASIAKFGEKHMEIFLDVDSFIDTIPEATAMATNVVSDLANPKANFSAKLKFPFPQIRLNDLITVPAGRFFEVDTQLAVVSFSHAKNETTIQLRGGAPIGMTQGWIKLEAGRVTEKKVFREPPVIGSNSGGGGGGAAFVLTTGFADGDTAWIKGDWNVAAWNAGDEYQMRIRISGDPDADYLISPIIQENTFKFLELASGAEYCGNVRAKGRGGTWSPWSLPQKCITTPTDTTPPAGPIGITCETINTGISVLWDLPSEIDYNFTRIWAHETQNPPLEVDANLAYEGRVPAVLTSRDNVALQPEVSYNIVAKHIDFSTNSSAASGVITCVTGRYTGQEAFIPGVVELEPLNNIVLSTVLDNVLTAVLIGAKENDVVFYVFTGQYQVSGTVDNRELDIFTVINKLLPSGPITDDFTRWRSPAIAAASDPTQTFAVHGTFQAPSDDPTIDVDMQCTHPPNGQAITSDMKLTAFVRSTKL